MMNSPLALLLAQALLVTHVASLQIVPLQRLATNGQLSCTKVDPGYECFNGMCPESDRTCVKINGGGDTCCQNKYLEQRDDPPPPPTEGPKEEPKPDPTEAPEEPQPVATEAPKPDLVATEKPKPDPVATDKPKPDEPKGSFCACDLDESGLAKEWAEQLWMDIVIILDTSAAMGPAGVIETTSIIESFASRMNLNDFSTPKYSRIGLITASAWPKIQYYFNMSSDSDLSYIKSDDLMQFNFDEAFKAAQYLFNFWTPAELHRGQVPRVIYLITNTRPPTNIAAATQFKQDGGTIIVTDFVQEGAVAQPLLQNLASPGYFFDDLTLDYTSNLVVFCGLNCFCPSSLTSGSGSAGAKNPSAGCFQPMTEPASYDRAVQTCASGQMGLATIRSAEEEENLVRVKGLPHWFGLRHDESNGFSWSDGENHSYSNWATQEPELENNQNCAYALKGTSKKIEWFTGNCHLPFYYACSSAPCSAERYCTEEDLFRSRNMISTQL